MTPDHIRRLLGGYATGTLSANQRRLLFEAALDDQELFDELARDQDLKELLDAPGVKERLAANIELTPQTDWWRHPFPWLMGGSAMAVSAGLMALVFLTPSGSKPKPSSPTEVAQNRPPVTAEAPSPQGSTQAQPELRNEPTPAPGAAPQPSGNPRAYGSVSSDAAAPPAPKLQNEPTADGAGEANKPQKTRDAETAVREKSGATAPAAAAPPAGRDGLVAGVAGAAPAPRAMAARAAIAPIGRFAFDYTVHDGVLRIVPASDGYLLVRAVVGPIDRLVLPTAHLIRATPAEFRIPDGASAMLIVFSARPVQEDSTEDLANRAPPSTGLSGSFEDPRPTVNSRLEVRIVVGGN